MKECLTEEVVVEAGVAEEEAEASLSSDCRVPVAHAYPWQLPLRQ